MNKTYLIIGSTGSTGHAVAQKLHAQGHSLILAARDNNKLSTQAAAFSAQSILMPDDAMSHPDVWKQTLANSIPNTLAGLIYTPGTITLKSLNRLQSADFEHDFHVNALGAAVSLQACIPALKRNEGRAAAVFFSSIAAQHGFSMHASIAMAKAALEGFVTAAAAELAPHIRINAIAPSLMKTSLSEKLLSNEATEKNFSEMHPLARIGQADDAAALAAFLLSEESDWISGQIIALDGGRSRLRPRG